MLQRIQTIWFLVATVVMGLTFVFDIYQHASTAQIPNLTLGNDVIGILLVIIAMALSLYTIFLFKNRKRQITFSWLSIIVSLATFAYLYLACERYMDNNGVMNGHYWIGLFLPLLSVVFLFMGMLGIKKDEKLIKSLDRLR